MIKYISYILGTSFLILVLADFVVCITMMIDVIVGICKSWF